MQFFNQLQQSRWTTPIIVASLLAAMAWQMYGGAKADAVTADEPIHLLSGYATLTEHHILFDPEHPFLIKAIAAVPLVWMNPTLPAAAIALTDEQRDVNYITYGEANRWGWEMLFKEGNDPYQLLLAARMMMIGLTLVMGLLLFWWARQLFGTVAGLASLALLAFDPTILAHGHLINTDAGASLMLLASLASLWQFLDKRSGRWLLITGVVVGLALLSKFSLAMLGVLIPILVGVWLLYHRRKLNSIALAQSNPLSRLAAKWPGLSAGRQVVISYGLAVVVIGLIGLAVVWLGYGLLWLLNPADNPMHQAALRHPLAAALLLFPSMFAKGFANVMSPRNSYLLGECYVGGRWDYFPTLLLFKLPLGSLALLVAGGLSTVMLVGKKLRFDRLPFVLWFLAISIVAYIVFSANAGINIGVRHVLPAYVLLLIPAGYVVAMIWHKASRLHNGQRWWRWLPVLLIAMVVSSSLTQWPHYISYYNELSGEPRSIPFISDDSNTDWGEGTRALEIYVKENNIPAIALDNFVGLTEARYLDIPLVPIRPDDHDYRGYLAISRSTMINHMCMQDNDWGWVTDNYQPIAIVGGSINIYLVD